MFNMMHLLHLLPMLVYSKDKISFSTLQGILFCGRRFYRKLYMNASSGKVYDFEARYSTPRFSLMKRRF